MVMPISKSQLLSAISITGLAIIVAFVSFTQSSKIIKLENDIADLQSRTENENTINPVVTNLVPSPTNGSDSMIDTRLSAKSALLFNSIDQLQWKKFRVNGDVDVEFEIPAIMEEANNWGRLDFHYNGVNYCGSEGDCDFIWFSVWPVETTNFLDDSSSITGMKFQLGGRESIGYTKSDPGDNICPEGWEVARNNAGKQIAFHFCSDRFISTSNGKDSSDPQVAKEKALYAQVVQRIRDSVKFID